VHNSLLLFILTVNLSSICFYSINPFTHLSISLFLSFVIILGVTFINLFIYRATFLSVFMPSGVPLFLSPLVFLIEVISYLARVVSLSIRILMQHCLWSYFSGSSIFYLFAFIVFTFN
jgi:F-type H+-transporting ATPase subunit a